MNPKPDIAELISRIGDPSRVAMLLCLLGGKALPASELARAARIKPQTASSYLREMIESGLLVHESYGRHRYYRIANDEVGQAVETLSAIAPSKPIHSRLESDQSKALHFARTCYDHIAGEVGVALTDKFIERGFIREEERNFVVTQDGVKWFTEFGIPVTEIRSGRRHFARQCLDWSERRHHMSGILGAAVTNRLFELKWIVRVPGGRTVRVTDAGLRGLEQKLEISLSPTCKI